MIFEISFKNATALCGGLDLSKEVLRVSVGLRAAELPAVKVGGRKKLPLGPAQERWHYLP